MRIALIVCSIIVAMVAWSPEAKASSDVAHPKQMHWQFDGVFGTFDRQSIQRGYQVYREVCAGCHAMHRVSYRNLEAIGFSEDEVKTIAAEYTVLDGPNESGEMFERPAKPSDAFVSPYPNEQASRAANNGAYPPDLSLIVKARPDGANYVYSILTGYNETVPAEIELGQLHYNPWFPGHKIAMAAPLSEGAVTYMDGTEATVEQMSKDVVDFLQWASEPEMEQRKQMGIKVLGFLAVFTVMFFFAMKRIWARVK